MAFQTLTATPIAADGAGTNLSALLATPTANTLQFQNTTGTILLVQASAISQGVTVEISALIEGQAVSPFPSVTLTSGDLYTFGPFHSVEEVPGTNLMNVSLSTGGVPGTPDTLSDLQVALITVPGVY